MLRSILSLQLHLHLLHLNRYHFELFELKLLNKTDQQLFLAAMAQLEDTKPGPICLTACENTLTQKNKVANKLTHILRNLKYFAADFPPSPYSLSAEKARKIVVDTMKLPLNFEKLLNVIHVMNNLNYTAQEFLEDFLNHLNAGEPILGSYFINFDDAYKKIEQVLEIVKESSQDSNLKKILLNIQALKQKNTLENITENLVKNLKDIKDSFIKASALYIEGTFFELGLTAQLYLTNKACFLQFIENTKLLAADKKKIIHLCQDCDRLISSDETAAQILKEAFYKRIERINRLLSMDDNLQLGLAEQSGKTYGAYRLSYYIQDALPEVAIMGGLCWGISEHFQEEITRLSLKKIVKQQQVCKQTQEMLSLYLEMASCKALTSLATPKQTHNYFYNLDKYFNEAYFYKAELKNFLGQMDPHSPLFTVTHPNTSQLNKKMVQLHNTQTETQKKNLEGYTLNINEFKPDSSYLFEKIIESWAKTAASSSPEHFILILDNYHKPGGHAVALSKTESGFFFKDANSGTYYFTQLDQLKAFLPAYFKKYYYTFIFDKLTFMPLSKQNKKTSNGKPLFLSAASQSLHRMPPPLEKKTQIINPFATVPQLHIRSCL